MNELAIPEDISKMLAAQAQEEVAAEKSGDRVFLSCRGKRWRIDEDELPSPLKVVVVATAYEKVYYDSAYDPDEPGVPACFGVQTDDFPSEPGPDSPNPQSKSCAECPHNKFGSALIGKGKACKDYRRMALYAVGPDGLDTSQMAQFKVPPTSLKKWSAYAKKVGLAHNLPTFAVVTEMDFIDKFDYPALTFDMAGPITSKEELEAIMAARESAQEMLLQSYDVTDYVPPKKGKSGKSKMS